MKSSHPLRAGRPGTQASRSVGHKSGALEGSWELVRTAISGDFPADLVVKNLPANAGDPGSIPDWGARIPYALGQLSPGAATREACVLQQRFSVAIKKEEEMQLQAPLQTYGVRICI